jgi:ribonuclease HI
VTKIEFFKELLNLGSIEKVLDKHNNLTKQDIEQFFREVLKILSDTDIEADDLYKLYTDGASKGNPGDAGIGFVIKKQGFTVEEFSKYIGKTTNNVAEYTAFIEGLKRLKELGVENVNAFSDSELMVKQINGIYSVKDEKLKQLYNEAIKLIKRFKSFKLEHILRDKNKEADKLSKEGSKHH